MKLRQAIFITAVSCLILSSGSAVALPVPNILGNTPPERLEEPPKGDVPLPKPETPPPAVQTGFFPELPPSVTCPPKYLLGLWELQHVYESPAGTELAAYNANPVQYVGFGKDTKYYKYNAGNARMRPEAVLDILKKHTGGVMQYLLEEGGMLYLYQDSVAIDTKVCFIVTDTLPPYPAGNMLLMPPKGTSATRVVKEYKKVWPRPKPTAPPMGNRVSYTRPPATPR